MVLQESEGWCQHRLLNTKFGGWFDRLHSVSCLTDEGIWTSDSGKHIKRFNLQGELKKTVKTKSGNKASDIEVTRDGTLVYTDYKDNTINLVTDGQIQPLVKLEGWKPYGLCRSTFDDQLVIMDNNDGQKTKLYVTLASGKNNVFSGTNKVNLFIHRHYLIVNTLLKTETWISVWLKLKLFDSVFQASLHSKTPCFTRTGNVN